MMTPRRYFTARPSTRCYISRHLHSGRGLDAETFGGAQLAGELFLLTSLFIEPEGCESDSCPGSQIIPTSNSLRFRLTARLMDLLEMAKTAGSGSLKPSRELPGGVAKSSRPGFPVARLRLSAGSARLVNCASVRADVL
jgi:hypothetical protein